MKWSTPGIETNYYNQAEKTRFTNGLHVDIFWLKTDGFVVFTLIVIMIFTLEKYVEIIALDASE